MSSVYKRGNITIFGPERPDLEFDTFTCKHCSLIIIIQPSKSEHVWTPPQEIAIIGATPEVAHKRKRQRGFCFRCPGPTCGRPKCIPCVPWEAKLEAQEGSRRFWKQIQLVG